ncbi:MAG: 50S ribosomal protein L29 [Alphaproteobacteria bacterium]|nr:50S ribosomal protein L29 [Alphaproteobacteria bacterium]
MAVKKNDFNKSLRSLSLSDINEKISSDENRLTKLRFSHTITPLENPKMMKLLKKDLARVKTELNHRKQLANQ